MGGVVVVIIASLSTGDHGRLHQLTALTYPGGSKNFSYSYNNLNQMTGATHNSKTTSFSYSPSGRMTGKTYPNGITTQMGYDDGGQISSLEVKKGSQTVKTYQVQRDNRANITSINEDGTSTTSYNYDASSRLTGESNPWMGNTTYSYDPAGNRLSREKQGVPTVSYTYNASDELLSDSEGNTYAYNTRGDLIRVDKGTYQKSLTWDGKGRLSSITDTTGLNQAYAYDPLDRTYTSSENGQSTTHLYEMTSDREIATLNQDQSLNSLFHSGVDGLISSTTTQGTSYYSYNPHSDVSLITDENGNTKSQLHYDAWGNMQEGTNEPYNYLGKYQRRTYSSPGLIKMGARFYDPNTGRFISRDPMKGQDEIPISHNPYIYAYDDPVNMKDLSGMSPIGDALRLLGAMYDMLGFHYIAVIFYMQAAIYDALEAGKTPPAQTPQTTRCFPFPLPRTIPFEPINTGHMEWSGELRYKYQSNHLVSNIGFRIRCQIDVEYIRSTTLGDLAGKILPGAEGGGEWAVYDNRGEVFDRFLWGHKLPNWGFIFSGSAAGPFKMSWATHSIVTSVLRLGVTISWQSIWELLVPIIVFPITEWFPYDVIEIPHFSDSY